MIVNRTSRNPNVGARCCVPAGTDVNTAMIANRNDLGPNVGVGSHTDPVGGVDVRM